MCTGIAPGLGQVYNGQATKALLLYALGWGIGLAALAILLGVPTAPWNVAIPGLVVLSWYVYVIFDAILTARRQGHTYHMKSYNKWYLYLLLIVIGAAMGEAAASTIRAWVIQAFKIPSGAMEETLLIGDHILVQKFAYRRHAPARGDLVVFPFPRDPSRDFIKRVIGLPGDRIEVRFHRTYVNDQLLQEPYVKLDERAVLHPSRYSHWGPEVVPPGRLLVLGDNRDNSADSRYWGFVDSQTVKGRAFLVYWSWDAQDGVRWRRIGRPLN